MPFQSHILGIIKKLVFNKKNCLKFDLLAFLSGYSNVYCHITCVLDVWHVSYEGIGDK